MRLRHNLISQKEYENRKRYLENNIDSIPEKEKEFQEKLGLTEFFIKKNNNLTAIIENNSSLINNSLAVSYSQ